MSREGGIDDLARRLASINAILAHDRRIRDSVREDLARLDQSFAKDLARLDQSIAHGEEVREDLLERLTQYGAKGE